MNSELFQPRLLLPRVWRRSYKLVDATVSRTYNRRMRYILTSIIDFVGTFMCFFIAVLSLIALFVSLAGLIFLQVPTSQSVFFNFPIIIASLLGSLVIVLTRRMVLRHIRFRTFYSTMQTAFASLKILMVVLILFLVINAIASSIGIILPQSLVNRIVLMIFSAVTCAISFVYYTFVDSQQQSQALSSACFGIASRERDASTKLWWVLKGSNEMSKYFSLLGFPIKEDSLKRILLNRLFQDRNNDRFLSSLSRKLTRGRPPVVILNQLNSSKGADLIDVGKQSLTKVAMLGFNEYAPALSLLVSLLGLIVAWVRH